VKKKKSNRNIDVTFPKGVGPEIDTEPAYKIPKGLKFKVPKPRVALDVALSIPIIRWVQTPQEVQPGVSYTLKLNFKKKTAKLVRVPKRKQKKARKIHGRKKKTKVQP